MKKKMLAYILPIVLMIGTTFGAGLVVGENNDWEPCQANTDVGVTVDYEKPTIDVCQVPWFTVECDGDIVIAVDEEEGEGVKIESPHHEPVEVVLEVWSDEYDDGEEGDAVRYAISDTIYVTADCYEEGQAYVGWTFELDDEEPFWAAGDWKLKGTMNYFEDFGGIGNERTDRKTAFEVEKCCTLVVTDEVSGTGVPEEIVYMDGDVYTLSANFAWELSAAEFDLFLDGDIDGPSLTGSVMYEGDTILTGAPAFEHDYDFEVSVYIGYGTYPGTYEGTATHILGSQ